MSDVGREPCAHDVLLADGGSAHIRPVRPDEAPRIEAFHRALSDETIHFRYFSGLAVLPKLILRRFTHPDPERECVLIAEVADDLIGLASYHRRGDEDAAEVAFVIADAHQGRGLGTLLLEALAEHARAHGVARFRADTLVGNRAMLRVFLDAGLAVEREADGGVVHVRFPTEETPRVAAAREQREHLAEARSVRRFVAPRSILLAGGRADGFRGPVYRELAALPRDVDLALFSGEARDLEAFVHACGDAGVHALCVGELRGAPEGDARAAFDRELRVAVRAQGMRLLGPDSLGIHNPAPDVALRAVALEPLPGPGWLAVASESPVRGAALLARLAERHIGVSSFVSVGRRADVSAYDCLSYWLDDPATRNIALELSSCGNPLKFARLAERVARAKPILALETGDPGQDALFARAGAELLPSLDALLARLP
ncbi:MAG: GNAT family N-acetyltransferase [Myxococcota bacterium]